MCALTSAAACSRPAVAGVEAADAPRRRELTWPASRSARAPVVMSGSWMMERRRAPRAAPGGWGAEAPSRNRRAPAKCATAAYRPPPHGARATARGSWESRAFIATERPRLWSCGGGGIGERRHVRYGGGGPTPRVCVNETVPALPRVVVVPTLMGRPTPLLRGRKRLNHAKFSVE